MATLVLFLNLCGLPRRALAAPTQAPTQNFTALRTEIAPSWVPDPENRGTWSLLYSCVFTLVLCVWTAIHLNVPSYHESQISQWSRKLKWVLLAIIAPEIGVYTAFEQYLQAKELIRELAEISVKRGRKGCCRTDQSEQESDPEKAASKRRVFSLIHGYFAVMGGLAVDVSDIDDQLRSVTLTPAGLKLLAERGHFIEVSDDDIRDKSKADIFAKCLVILQVTWLAVQTISRKAAGYPLSPLEIHTLVHAACALVMYILWFRKPLDVQAPVIVSKAGFEDLIALMLMQNSRIGTTWYSHLDPPEDFKPIDVKSPRSEASFLMFDDSALSRRDEGSSSCGGHSTPSTPNNEEVADKGVLHALAETCDNCLNLPNSKCQEARTSDAGALSSQITWRPLAGIRCGPPPDVRAVCGLRSGDFTTEGIGLQPLMTRSSYHDRYIPLPWWCCFLSFLHPCPLEPVLPAQVSHALKQRLPTYWHEKPEKKKPRYWHEIHLSLSEQDRKRWKLAGDAFLKEIEIQGVSDPGNGRYWNFEIAELFNFRDSKDDTINGWPRIKPLLARRCRNLHEFDPQTSYTLLLTLWILGSLYGGIHLALWNYDFPSRAETFLWRVSAATLGSMPVLFLLVMLLVAVLDEYDDYIKRREFRRAQESHENDAFQRAPPSSSSTNWLRKIFAGFCSGVRDIWESWAEDMFWMVVILMFGLVIWTAMLLYVFARIFIVVESFISLRHVPIGVYEGGLGWSKYIPHL
ncbi:hypothetical protein JMJ35_001617 [Cladonia borealis]|uniref:Uncharacterized protein n=1 Tax=Cladonia borealis TaxID=184061 RepID=A0AA39R652_9LECA|nr:hypothetical protein JMJ35_001617 [Cladonia borealis]